MLRKSANFDLNVQPIIEESEAEAVSGNVSFLIESSGYGGQSLGSLRDRLSRAKTKRESSARLETTHPGTGRPENQFHDFHSPISPERLYWPTPVPSKCIEFNAGKKEVVRDHSSCA